ncbi:hypothetical protein [Sinomonas flava]|uniref:hypothetical protein n=1 Tax=Sinomonas TaxID=596707 RepID=UPI0031E30E86
MSGRAVFEVIRERLGPRDALANLAAFDPVQLTEVSVILSAVALPLTHIPIMIVANDRNYMGEHVNGRWFNAVGTLFLALILAAALPAIPLMVLSGAGS